MDRAFGSDDMSAERHQDAIDADREAHGYRCLHCGETGMTEDKFIFHRCPEDTEPDVDDEDPGMQPTEYDRLLSREAEQWAIETGREPEPGA